MTSFANFTAPLPLKIGIHVDSYVQPRWIYQIIEDIAESEYGRIEYLSIGNKEIPVERLENTSPLMLSSNRSLFNLYSSLDDRVFSRPQDALNMLDMRDIINSKGFSCQSRDFPDSTVDIHLMFSRNSPCGNKLSQARYGVWYLYFGPFESEGLEGFFEVLEGTPITITELRVDGFDGSIRRVIARIYSRTDVRSVRRSRSNIYSKAGRIVIRKLKEVCEQGSKALIGLGPPEGGSSIGSPIRTHPSNLSLVMLLFRHGERYVREILDRIFSTEQWFIAFRLSGKERGCTSIGYAFPPPDRFWADPFPVYYNGRWYIFFEELVYGESKGSISYVVVGEDMAVSKSRVVLTRPYHLAYPFQFQYGNDHFMIPDTNESNKIEIYRAKSFPDDWELVDVVMSNVSGADPTLKKIGEEWWLFAGLAVKGTPYCSEELHLFHSTSPFGPWVPHRRNPVLSDIRNSRPAGGIMEKNGRLIRPAQDCSVRYGYGISFNTILTINHNDYVEEKNDALLPSWNPKIVATHTINTLGNLTVIDACIKRSIYSNNIIIPDCGTVLMDLERIGIPKSEVQRGSAFDKFNSRRVAVDD